MSSLTSIGWNSRYSAGVKKPFAIKACLVVGKEVREKLCFLSLLLSKRQRKVTETYLPSTTIRNFFKMANTRCLLREQWKPSFFVSLGSKAWYVQRTFFSLEPTQVVMAVLADRHLYCRAKGSQPGMWILCCGGFDCRSDAVEPPSVTPEVSI